MRHVAVVVMMACALGSARLLVCELDCRDVRETQQTQSCHEHDGSAPATLAQDNTHHDCDHPADAAVVVARKLSASPLAGFDAVSTPATSPSFVRWHDAGTLLLARPPGGAIPRPSARQSVLRI
jgi:hypothetical protein